MNNIRRFVPFAIALAGLVIVAAPQPASAQMSMMPTRHRVTVSAPSGLQVIIIHDDNGGDLASWEWASINYEGSPWWAAGYQVEIVNGYAIVDAGARIRLWSASDRWFGRTPPTLEVLPSRVDDCSAELNCGTDISFRCEKKGRRTKCFHTSEGGFGPGKYWGRINKAYCQVLDEHGRVVEQEVLSCWEK